VHTERTDGFSTELGFEIKKPIGSIGFFWAPLDKIISSGRKGRIKACANDRGAATTSARSRRPEGDLPSTNNRGMRGYEQ
jgi:hypothetical protein